MRTSPGFRGLDGKPTLQLHSEMTTAFENDLSGQTESGQTESGHAEPHYVCRWVPDERFSDGEHRSTGQLAHHLARGCVTSARPENGVVTTYGPLRRPLGEEKAPPAAPRSLGLTDEKVRHRRRCPSHRINRGKFSPSQRNGDDRCRRNRKAGRAGHASAADPGRSAKVNQRLGNRAAGDR